MPKGHFRCWKCLVCPQTIEGKTIDIPELELHIPLNHFSTCRTSNAVYIIKCRCPHVYRGSSTRPLKARILEHKLRIKLKVLDAPMVSHFLDKAHAFNDFGFSVLYESKLMDPQMIQKDLLKYECLWIHKLHTMELRGLNASNDFSCFL